MDEEKFSFRRSLKLGSFHIGSSLTDLLLSAVWNRVMVVDLGIAAWPVALLAALRYLLAPFTLWAGHRSDTRPIMGSRRVAYIWIGRGMMLLSLPLLPLVTLILAGQPASPVGWGLALLSFTIYGVGTLISGPPFLALVHDSAPYARRGQAVAVVQFMLVASFAFLPALYAQVMPTYDQALFWRLVMVAMAGATVFWWFSVWQEEKQVASNARIQPSVDFRVALREIWRDQRARRYAIFLGASAFFAFMQDAVLEPFGGDVFGLPVGDTTRFNAYWGLGVIVSMGGTFFATRRRRPHEQTGPTTAGLALVGLALFLLAASAQAELLWLVAPVLFLFGLGLGMFTVGGVSLLMAMNKAEKAASYLALWSVIQLLGRGLGIAAGGALRDVLQAISGEFNVTYASIFALEAAGILACILLLRRVDVAGFARSATLPETAEVISALAD